MVRKEKELKKLIEKIQESNDSNALLRIISLELAMPMPTQTTNRLKTEFENAEHELKQLKEEIGDFPTPSEEDKLLSAKTKLEQKKEEYLNSLGQIPNIRKRENVVREPGIEYQSNPWVKYTPTMFIMPPTGETVLVAGYFKSNPKKIHYYTGEFDGKKWKVNKTYLDEINAVFIVTHWQRINTNLS